MTLLSRQDIDFLLHDWLGVADLVDRDTADAILDLSEKAAARDFLPHYKLADREQPELVDGAVHILPAIGDALKSYADLGLFGAGFAEEVGGFGLPHVLCSASFAWFAAASIATSAYPMLTAANARLLTTFGTAAQVDAFARPQIAGRWFGTMCLSEPQAGSSLADVATQARAEGEDVLGPRYRLTGSKMWISGGDQDVSANIVHLVLAKIVGADSKLPEGTEGLSLFIVPKLLPDGGRNDIVVAGLNHKMGYRGTSNCLLSFGEMGGATGWLVGAPGQGLRQMFHMMNEARISVGLGAAALGYRAYLLSATYARERLQGRPAGQRGGAPVAIIEHPDVQRMLLSQKACAEGALALCLYCAKLVDEAGDADKAALLSLLTPIAKTWPSEYGLAANDIAIQIHGGYGYTQDFDVEQLYRDNRLNPIHEGTTGVQGTDLLGRKILGADNRGLDILRREIADAAAASGEFALFGEALAAAWQEVEAAIDAARAMAPGAWLHHATPFLWAFGHVVLAWQWLSQAQAAARHGDERFAFGKAQACRHFFTSELPKVAPWLAPMRRGDASAPARTDYF